VRTGSLCEPEQVEAFRAENNVTARETIVILLSFFTSEELQEAEGNRRDLQFPHPP
jgi:hypothetical protein